MLRNVVIGCALIALAGCGSGDDPSGGESTGDPSNLGIGSNSQAVDVPWDGTVSTRSPVKDNTLITLTSTIGQPGVVPDSAAGFCWITQISGSFRGAGDFAKIIQNTGGYYQAAVQSTTAHDGVTGVGPALSVRCRHLTDFIALSHVPEFKGRGWSASGWPPGTGNYGQATSSLSSGSIYTWTGAEGRFASAGNAMWMIAAVDHGSDTVFARWPNATCPLQFPAYCKVYSQAWEVYSDTHFWTYSANGRSATNTSDVQLVAAAGQECLVDGMWGQWTSTSSATVQVEADGYWHLVTQKGSGTLGMGAYASCFPISQAL